MTSKEYVENVVVLMYMNNAKCTKEEGNKFWMMLKKNEFTSKKGNTLTKIDINWRK